LAKYPNYKIQFIIIQIHISFNPFKWIYLKSKFIFLILNLIHLIGYGLDIDWIHFWIIQIAFWVGFWLGPIQVEPRQFGFRLSKVALSSRQAESSEPKSNRVGMGQSRPSRSGPKSSRVNPGPSRAKWSSRVGRGRYWAELSQANVYSSRSMPKSSWLFRV